MSHYTYIMDLEDVDADGIAEAQTLAGAEDFVLDGALVGADGVFRDAQGHGRLILLDSAGNDSGITFTVYGQLTATSPVISEAVTGGNVGAVSTTNYFAVVTRIASSGATADNVTIGTQDEAAYIIPLDSNKKDYTVSVTITGTTTIDVQQTADDLLGKLDAGTTVNWADITALTNKSSGTTIAGITSSLSGLRIDTDSYTNGASIEISVLTAEV